MRVPNSNPGLGGGVASNAFVPSATQMPLSLQATPLQAVTLSGAVLPSLPAIVPHPGTAISFQSAQPGAPASSLVGSATGSISAPGVQIANSTVPSRQRILLPPQTTQTMVQPSVTSSSCPSTSSCPSASAVLSSGLSVPPSKAPLSLSSATNAMTVGRLVPHPALDASSELVVCASFVLEASSHSAHPKSSSGAAGGDEEGGEDISSDSSSIPLAVHRVAFPGARVSLQQVLLLASGERLHPMLSTFEGSSVPASPSTAKISVFAKVASWKRKGEEAEVGCEAKPALPTNSLSSSSSSLDCSSAVERKERVFASSRFVALPQYLPLGSTAAADLESQTTGKPSPPWVSLGFGEPVEIEELVFRGFYSRLSVAVVGVGTPSLPLSLQLNETFRQSAVRLGYPLRDVACSTRPDVSLALEDGAKQALLPSVSFLNSPLPSLEEALSLHLPSAIMTSKESLSGSASQAKKAEELSSLSLCDSEALVAAAVSRLRALIKLHLLDPIALLLQLQNEDSQSASPGTRNRKRRCREEADGEVERSDSPESQATQAALGSQDSFTETKTLGEQNATLQPSEEGPHRGAADEASDESDDKNNKAVTFRKASLRSKTLNALSLARVEGIGSVNSPGVSGEEVTEKAQDERFNAKNSLGLDLQSPPDSKSEVTITLQAQTALCDEKPSVLLEVPSVLKMPPPEEAFWSEAILLLTEMLARRVSAPDERTDTSMTLPAPLWSLLASACSLFISEVTAFHSDRAPCPRASKAAAVSAVRSLLSVEGLASGVTPETQDALLKSATLRFMLPKQEPAEVAGEEKGAVAETACQGDFLSGRRLLLPLRLLRVLSGVAEARSSLLESDALGCVVQLLVISDVHGHCAGLLEGAAVKKAEAAEGGLGEASLGGTSCALKEITNEGEGGVGSSALTKAEALRSLAVLVSHAPFVHSLLEDRGSRRYASSGGEEKPSEEAHSPGVAREALRGAGNAEGSLLSLLFAAISSQKAFASQYLKEPLAAVVERVDAWRAFETLFQSKLFLEEKNQLDRREDAEPDDLFGGLAFEAEGALGKREPALRQLAEAGLKAEAVQEGAAPLALSSQLHPLEDRAEEGREDALREEVLLLDDGDLFRAAEAVERCTMILQQHTLRGDQPLDRCALNIERDCCIGRELASWTAEGAPEQFVQRLPFFVLNFLTLRNPLQVLHSFARVVETRLSLSATAHEGDVRLVNSIRLFLASLTALPCGVQWLVKASADTEEEDNALLDSLEEASVLLLKRAAALPHCHTGKFDRGGIADATDEFFPWPWPPDGEEAEENKRKTALGRFVGRLIGGQGDAEVRRGASSPQDFGRYFVSCESHRIQTTLQRLMQASGEGVVLTATDIQESWSVVDEALADLAPSDRDTQTAVALASTAATVRLKKQVAKLIDETFWSANSSQLPRPRAPDARRVEEEASDWKINVSALLALEALAATKAGAAAVAPLLASSGASGLLVAALASLLSGKAFEGLCGEGAALGVSKALLSLVCTVAEADLEGGFLWVYGQPVLCLLSAALGPCRKSTKLSTNAAPTALKTGGESGPSVSTESELGVAGGSSSSDENKATSGGAGAASKMGLDRRVSFPPISDVLLDGELDSWTHCGFSSVTSVLVADEALRRRVSFLCSGLSRLLGDAASSLPSPAQVYEALADFPVRPLKCRVKAASFLSPAFPSAACLLSAIRINERPCGLKGPPQQELAESAVVGSSAAEEYDAQSLPHAVGVFAQSSEACSLLAGSLDSVSIEMIEVDWGAFVGEEAVPPGNAPAKDAGSGGDSSDSVLDLLVDPLAAPRVALPLLLLLAKRCPTLRFFQEEAHGEVQETTESDLNANQHNSLDSEAEEEALGSTSLWKPAVSAETPQVPTLPGLGCKLLASQDGLGALLSCAVRCVACLEASRVLRKPRPAPWLVPRGLQTGGGGDAASFKYSGRVAEVSSESLLTLERENVSVVLPVLSLVLSILRLCLQRLGLDAQEDAEEAAAALEEAQGLVWLGLRRTALQQVLVLTVAELLQQCHLQSERRRLISMEQRLWAEAEEPAARREGALRLLASYGGFADETELETRKALASCLELQRLWTTRLPDSQASQVSGLLRQCSGLPFQQMAALLLLRVSGPWRFVLPPVPHSFHIVPATARPTPCPPRELAAVLKALGAEPALVAAAKEDSQLAKSQRQPQVQGGGGGGVASQTQHVVTLSARLPSLLQLLRDPYVPPPFPMEEDAILPEEPMPLFLVCRVRVASEISRCVEGEEDSPPPRLPVFGHLTMGAVSPVSETAAEDALPEEMAAAEALACWARLREAATGVYIQRVFKGDFSGGDTGASSAQTSNNTGAATTEGGAEAEGSATSSSSVSPVVALRKHLLASEAVRLEDVAELLSLICRSSLSSDAFQRQLAASTAAFLAVQGLPVYSLLFDCMDGLLSSALGSLEVDTPFSPFSPKLPKEEAETATEGPSPALTADETQKRPVAKPDPAPFFLNIPVYAAVPRTLFLLEGKRLLRLLTFVERLLLQHAKSAEAAGTPEAVYRQLVRIVTLPSPRLFEVAVMLLSNGPLRASAAKRGGAPSDVRSEEEKEVSQLSEALLEEAVRLGAVLTRLYQRLSDVSLVFRRSGGSGICGLQNFSSAAEWTAPSLANLSASLRSFFSSVSLLAVDGNLSLTLRLHCLAAASAALDSPFTGMLLNYDVPPHSFSALSVAMKNTAGGGVYARDKEAEGAVAASSSPVLRFGSFVLHCVEALRGVSKLLGTPAAPQWISAVSLLTSLAEKVLSVNPFPAEAISTLFAKGKPRVARVGKTEDGAGGSDEEIEALLAEDLVSIKGEEAGQTNLSVSSRGELTTSGLKSAEPVTAVRQLAASLLTCLSQCELLLPPSGSSFGVGLEASEERRRRAQLLALSRLSVITLDRIHRLEQAVGGMSQESSPLFMISNPASAEAVNMPQLLSTALFLPPERGDAAIAFQESRCRHLALQRVGTLSSASLRCTAQRGITSFGTSSGGASISWVEELRRVFDDPLEELFRLEAAMRHEEETLPGFALAFASETVDCQKTSASPSGQSVASEWIKPLYSDPLSHLQQLEDANFPVPREATMTSSLNSSSASRHATFAMASRVQLTSSGGGRPQADPFRARAKGSSRAPSKHVDAFEAAVPGGLSRLTQQQQQQQQQQTQQPPPPPGSSAGSASGDSSEQQPSYVSPPVSAGSSSNAEDGRVVSAQSQEAGASGGGAATGASESGVQTAQAPGALRPPLAEEFSLQHPQPSPLASPVTQDLHSQLQEKGTASAVDSLGQTQALTSLAGVQPLGMQQQQQQALQQQQQQQTQQRVAAAGPARGYYAIPMGGVVTTQGQLLQQRPVLLHPVPILQQSDMVVQPHPLWIQQTPGMHLTLSQPQLVPRHFQQQQLSEQQIQQQQIQQQQMQQQQMQQQQIQQQQMQQQQMQQQQMHHQQLQQQHEAQQQGDTEQDDDPAAACPGWREFVEEGRSEGMDIRKLMTTPELLKDPRIRSRFLRLLDKHEQAKELFRLVGANI